MVFSSTVFLFLFFPAVFVLHLVMPNKTAKNLFLTAASLVFYAYGEPVMVLLMLLSAFANYALALALQRTAHRRAVLVSTVALNIGVLFVFKYLGFFVKILVSITGLPIPVPSIRLPIGISFFSFQALSYVIDVYRGACHAQRNFGKVLLYISFFPQLIAGPIVKYHDIAAQLDDRTVTPQGCAEGLRRFACGMAKKLLIANAMAVVADAIFALDPALVNAPVAWLGGIAYTFQIYFDFSGYSDMAIGLGEVFGFRFPENFDYPLFASSMREFWRKWHISLTTWFREYLYIPLGGNRKGEARKALNTMIVFTLTGLWHGANFTFVLWGILNGLCLLAEDLWAKCTHKKRGEALCPRAIGHLYTFVLAVILFTMFRADTVNSGLTMIAKQLFGWQFSAVAMAEFYRFFTPLFCATLLAAFVLCTGIVRTVWRKWQSGRAAKAVDFLSFLGTLGLLFLCMLDLSGTGYNPFIYFQF